LEAILFVPRSDAAHSIHPSARVDDAKDHYSRFLVLGRKSHLANNLDLSLAQVRYKTLSLSQSLRTKAWRALIRGSLDEVTSYVNDNDPGLQALSIFTAASKTYRSGDVSGALSLLKTHRSEFGPLRDECEFLSAKLMGYLALEATTQAQLRSRLDEVGVAFSSLAKRFSDDHYLLDDLYYVWASLEQDPRHKTQIITEGVRRCHSDADEYDALKAMLREVKGMN
jgi:hypothetical protein